METPRVIGHDPQGRSYYSFASFEDPDGNGWLLRRFRRGSRPRVEFDPTTDHGRCNLGRAPPRDGGAPRPLRTTRRTSLVGLMRAISERASTGAIQRRQQPPQSLHGRGPSHSSPMMPFESPLFTSLRTMFKCIKIPNLRNVGQTQSYESVVESPAVFFRNIINLANELDNFSDKSSSLAISIYY